VRCQACELLASYPPDCAHPLPLRIKFDRWSTRIVEQPVANESRATQAFSRFLFTSASRVPSRHRCRVASQIASALLTPSPADADFPLPFSALPYPASRLNDPGRNRSPQSFRSVFLPRCRPASSESPIVISLPIDRGLGKVLRRQRLLYPT